MSNETAVTIVAAVVAIGLVLYIARRIGKIAERRGRSFPVWALFALFLPIPAIVLIYILPNKAPPDLGAVARQF